MGIVTWIVFGAIAGWLGFRMVGDRTDRGCLTNIVIGIGGAMLGGSLVSIVTGDNYLFATGFTKMIVNMIASVIGAAALIFGLKKLGERG